MASDPAALLQAAEWLRAAREVVVFTGAGASAESGIPTFRDDAGLWQRFPPEHFASWNSLVKTAAADPRRLAEFLLAVIRPVAMAIPNAGHRAIVQLEEHKNVTVVTQNIDRLHQEAGSTTVWEIHGSLFEIVGLQGQFVRLLSRHEMLEMIQPLVRIVQGPFPLPRLLVALRPMLGVGAGVFHRPNVVLFGDAMAEPDWTLACEAARRCDLFITAGTSGLVQPAASLPDEASAAGARIIAVNPEPAPGDVWLKGTSIAVLPALLEAAFS